MSIEKVFTGCVFNALAGTELSYCLDNIKKEMLRAVAIGEDLNISYEDSIKSLHELVSSVENIKISEIIK